METIVKTRIVKIGNSQGIRIPKLLLDQADFSDEIELVVARHQIVIRPIHVPRQGWDEQFKKMAENGDDYLIDDDVLLSSWDEEEWVWE